MATDEQLRGAIAAAMEGFAAAVAAIGPADWAKPSPCDGWSVRDVVDEPVAAARAAAADARTGFDGPLDHEVEHPVGLISARRFLGFRIMDQLGHTWDIATGTGRPAALDAEAVRVAIEVAVAEREMLDASAHFAMSSDVAVDSGNPGSTVLQMIGRDPGAASS